MATLEASDSERGASPAVLPTAQETDPNTITTKSLEALQGDNQRKVMDIVDRLRRTGLSGVVGLPQLVVCGDQSSGKSSVLEAITEIPFPRKENLCTRFATEIVLRRHFESSIITRITPDKTRPKEEQKKLGEFSKSITDFDQLPEIIEEATSVMGLGNIGESSAFSRDVLSIEITGPARPQLTLVDLSGLIHATNRAQTESDKALILDLVQEYMKNPRTIILPVVSAKNDFANQIILEHCKSIDFEGRRTLGIITKPDYLREGSENELAWMDLAQNRDIYLERGWHMLKNRAENEKDFSFDNRNESERQFFSKGRYRGLPRDMLGIETLRTRLSALLQNHLVKELPSLKDELTTKLKETRQHLESLGEKRGTISEQRMFLTKVSMEIHDVIKAAVKGHYDHRFFGPVDIHASVDSMTNIRRIRAVTQYLNLQFAENMRLCGHRYAVGPGPGDDDADVEEATKALETVWLLHDDEHDGLPIPAEFSREDTVAWVQGVLERSRGCELPGNFNPMLISHLFWELSQPWEELAEAHIDKVAEACRNFAVMVLQYVASPEIESRLASISMDAALDAAVAASRKELKNIIDDKARHPMTYNHYFTTTIQRQRQRKHGKVVAKAKSECMVQAEKDGKTYQRFDPGLLEQQLAKGIEQDMDKFSSEEALDNTRAYYKDEMKYFIHAVTKQVIERHLVNTLPENILSPAVIASFSDEEIAFVTAEPPEVTHQRDHLESRKGMLEKGLKTFKQVMGGLKR